jgi:hypothetical protein
VELEIDGRQVILANVSSVENISLVEGSVCLHVGSVCGVLERRIPYMLYKSTGTDAR